MKETVIIIVSLALVFTPSFIFKNFLDRTGRDVLNILDSMKEDIKNDMVPNDEKAEALKETFLEKEKSWIMIVNHEILNEIEDGIEECVFYYNYSEKAEFLSACGRLKNHIEDLKKREEISVVNIF